MPGAERLMQNPLTISQEREILISLDTRELVHEVLSLAETRDIFDAARDVQIASKILAGRVDRILHGGRGDKS